MSCPVFESIRGGAKGKFMRCLSEIFEAAAEPGTSEAGTKAMLLFPQLVLRRGNRGGKRAVQGLTNRLSKFLEGDMSGIMENWREWKDTARRGWESHARGATSQQQRNAKRALKLVEKGELSRAT